MLPQTQLHTLPATLALILLLVALFNLRSLPPFIPLLAAVLLCAMRASYAEELRLVRADQAVAEDMVRVLRGEVVRLESVIAFERQDALHDNVTLPLDLALHRLVLLGLFVQTIYQLFIFANIALVHSLKFTCQFGILAIMMLIRLVRFVWWPVVGGTWWLVSSNVSTPGWVLVLVLLVFLALNRIAYDSTISEERAKAEVIKWRRDYYTLARANRNIINRQEDELGRLRTALSGQNNDRDASLPFTPTN
ncbi:uncharacterized protein LOC62_03G003758 [Vanrija pseudolonga]|uniref:Uncharacterized protein n=1 Tax=Vanrija pseudolonga TaxID=143232 RepID=A0AAF1BHH2_9TREE|nr:hypothetical protein LOC62_03G003758 [Vanrija pseudolonga]